MNESCFNNREDFIIYYPLKNGKGEYECIPYSFYGSLTSFSEDKDLIDFLHTCFYTKEECEKWIEKQKEPYYTKRNALFDKCVENYDPAVMKKVPDEFDEMLNTKKKSSIVEKLRIISTPADEDWFKIEKKWEAEDNEDLRSFISVKFASNAKVIDGKRFAVFTWERFKDVVLDIINRGKEKQKEQKRSLDFNAISLWLRDNVHNYINWEFNEFHHCVEYDGTINIEKLIADLKVAVDNGAFDVDAAFDTREPRDNCEYIKEFCDKFGRIPKDMDELDALVSYVMDKKQKEQEPNIELIQRSWYMEGYNDRKFGNEPKWVIKTGEGGPKHELNPKYGQPLAEKQKPVARENDFVSKPIEWSEEDKDYYDAIIAKIEVTQDDAMLTDNQIDFLKSLPERFNLQPKEEWSEEDKEKIDEIIRIICNARECSKIANIGEEKEDNSAFYDELVLFLKSLRPKPKSVKEKESYINGFETARRNVARAFMQYLDDNRIDRKMCLSNGECEDIEMAFSRGDWDKINRYANKYLPHWKPSEEQIAILSWFCNGVIDGVCAPDLREKLKSLYNELKKLI